MIWQPEREIKIVAGTPPGGGLDRSARALLKAITDNGLLDVPVRVVNVGGEGGRKAWRYVEQHAGDGHVIGISSPNMTADYLLGVTKSDPARFAPLAILTWKKFGTKAFYLTHWAAFGPGPERTGGRVEIRRWRRLSPWEILCVSSGKSGARTGACQGAKAVS